MTTRQIPIQRQERFEMVYVDEYGKTRYCYPKSREQKDRNLQVIKERNLKLLRVTKLYPFSTMRNQHNFDLISNICANTMYDMQNGDIAFDEDEYERLAETRDKAQKFFCMDLPVAWVPWETYREMKEMAASACCHRDEMNARAKHANYHSGYDDDFDEYDDRDSDWRPGDAPWKAPGMSARDFVR